MHNRYKYRLWHNQHQKMYRVFELNNGVATIVTQENGSQLFLVPHDPDNHILMEYTGLNDRNKQEIYEGDVVVHDYATTYGREKDQTGIVVFDKGCYAIKYNKPNEQGGFLELLGMIHSDLRVLGYIDTLKTSR